MSKMNDMAQAIEELRNAAAAINDMRRSRDEGRGGIRTCTRCQGAGTGSRL